MVYGIVVCFLGTQAAASAWQVCLLGQTSLGGMRALVAKDIEFNLFQSVGDSPTPRSFLADLFTAFISSLQN